MNNSCNKMNDSKTRKKNAIIAQQVSEKMPAVKALPARPLVEEDDAPRVRICRLLMPKKPLNG